MLAACWLFDCYDLIVGVVVLLTGCLVRLLVWFVLLCGVVFVG